MPVIEIKNEKLTVGIDTFGAELKYVNGCNGTKFMWPGEVGVWKSTAPILFPFCGFFKDDTYYVITNNGDDTTLCVQSCPFQQNLFRLKRMLLLCLMVLQKPE